MVEELHREGMAGLAQGSEGVFGSVAVSVGKFASDGASPLCPECSSSKVWRDGLRGGVQRWLCRGCGLRFSGSKVLNADSADTSSCQISARSAKNLALTLEKASSAGAEKKLGHRFKEKPVDPEVRALSQVFRSWLLKEGYARGLLYPNNLLTLSRLGADLKDPESVKTVIAKHDIKDGTRLKYVYAYAAFAKMMKISWEPPHYTQEEILPYIPDEADLDQLVAACRSRRMATYLQTLKETFADPSEALRIEWKEVSGNIVTINHPVKGHLPRQLEVSDKLIAMLNALPKNSERIFPVTYRTMFSLFSRVRKRAADAAKNPRLLLVKLNGFRHWGGTMLAEITNGNVLIVKQLLGHKRVENTMKYIGMIRFQEDPQFDVATATTMEEAKPLVSQGFEFIVEKHGVMLFRKLKRFGMSVNTRRSQLRKSYPLQSGDVSRAQLPPSFSLLLVCLMVHWCVMHHFGQRKLVMEVIA